MLVAASASALVCASVCEWSLLSWLVSKNKTKKNEIKKTAANTNTGGGSGFWPPPSVIPIPFPSSPHSLPSPYPHTIHYHSLPSSLPVRIRFPVQPSTIQSLPWNTPVRTTYVSGGGQLRLCSALLVVVLPLLAAHSNLIKPKPRNAIDSELPEWADGNAPYLWVPSLGKNGTPCACRNGTDVCASAQTCLWFNVGW